MATPAKWNWNISNNNATVAQTQAAYNAITHNGPTRNFSVIVWNDMIDKISEQRRAWGDTDWSKAGATKGEVYMIPGEWLTARIFNAAVLNMPPFHTWGWESTLGRKELRKGDVCYGSYFIYLMEGLNRWIDLPPMPFVVHIPIGVSLNPNVLVRRTAHIISGQHFYLGASAHSVIKRTMHAQGRLKMKVDMSVSAPLFHTQHVGILLYGNVWLRNNMIRTSAAHVVASNNVSLDIKGKITFGDVAFLIGEISDAFALGGTVSIPASVPILISNPVELFQNNTMSIVAPQSFIVDVNGEFNGEAYVREPDSVLIKENLIITQTGSANISFPDIHGIICELLAELSPTVTATATNAGNLLTDLKIQLDSNLLFSTPDTIPIGGDFTGVSQLKAYIDRRRRTLLSGDLTTQLDTSAKVIRMPTMLCTGTEITMQSQMSATAAFAAREVYTGTNIVSNFSTTAKASFATQEQGFKVRMSDVITINADAAISHGIMNTGATLSDALIGSQATILAPAHPLYTSAHLSDTSDMAASVSTINEANITTLKGGMQLMHTGSGAVDIDETINSAVDIDATFSGSVLFDHLDVARIHVNAEFAHLGTATLTVVHYVLASEIDDVLVSDLDDTLVANVEFHF